MLGITGVGSLPAPYSGHVRSNLTLVCHVSCGSMSAALGIQVNGCKEPQGYLG